MIWWYQLKELLALATGFSMDALHVVAEVLLQLVAAAALRSSVARWLPWLAVLALELINEVSDLYVEQWPQRGIQYGEGVSDLLLTLALPTVLLLTARR
ncbi:hypothetical protein ACFQPG_10255 [Sphingomonas sp. GCM10030256]|uniref:hypothetical protein n=1 Tax=Sphingomonas sp. GCM10030256 TaxID=3273427 RepID=UPI0036166CE2